MNINRVSTNRHVDKSSPGQKMTGLQKQLIALDFQEKGIKNHMQDRMKFMSGKNAYRYNSQLGQIDKKREQIQARIALLQVKA